MRDIQLVGDAMAKLYITGILVSLLILTGEVYAEQAIGLQADMIGQGICYRYLSTAGFGGEFVGRAMGWKTNNENLTYTTNAELRGLKFFNLDRRIRLFIGAGAGIRANRSRYEYNDSDSLVNNWRSQWGISVGFLTGLDAIVLKLQDGSGFSISPELQFGYYTWFDPSYYPEPEPLRFVSPGVGIGIHYIW